MILQTLQAKSLVQFQNRVCLRKIRVNSRNSSMKIYKVSRLYPNEYKSSWIYNKNQYKARKVCQKMFQAHLIFNLYLVVKLNSSKVINSLPLNYNKVTMVMKNRMEGAMVSRVSPYPRSEERASKLLSSKVNHQCTKKCLVLIQTIKELTILNIETVFLIVQCSKYNHNRARKRVNKSAQALRKLSSKQTTIIWCN